MTLKLADLIAQCGDDVQFSEPGPLRQALSISITRRGASITFGTEMNIHGPKGTERLGLVVWLDREKVAEVLAASKAGA